MSNKFYSGFAQHLSFAKKLIYWFNFLIIYFLKTFQGASPVSYWIKIVKIGNYCQLKTACCWPCSQFVVPPLLLPFSSHFPPILGNGLETDQKRRRNGPETDLERRYNGLTTELHQKGNPSIFRVFSQVFKHTGSPNFRLIFLLLRLSAAYTPPYILP